MNRIFTGSKVDDMSVLRLRYSDSSRGCRPRWKLWKDELSCIINSYPKEWLAAEIESDPLLGHDLADVESFEPFWKIILGNKAILPLLWQMYPNHPNLLPAYFENPKELFGTFKFDRAFEDEHWVSKPLYGREGLGVFYSQNFTNVSNFDSFV